MVVELLGEGKIKITNGGFVICELFSANKFATFCCWVNRKIKIIDSGYAYL